ncbi:hypothetical protein E6C72_17370 [Azospirillum sp. TSH100]|nr:hypothetical protein E6C72_17370 [Azospirillum sp. TSH100]
MNHLPLLISPLPPGERVRVRETRYEDSRYSHPVHPPHPGPLPGGRGGPPVFHPAVTRSPCP